VQSNTSTETSTLKVGDIGEQLVAEHFKHAERTDDWFDSEKDGTLKDKTYEVKTFRLNNNDQGFWVDSSQFRKLDNVDILYFAYEPIYVGKGVNKGGYRMNQHISQFLNKKDHNYIKRKKFEEIEKKMKENGMTWNDYKNNYIIIYKTFNNEEELLENELELINKIGTQWTKTGPLVNKITKYQQEKFKRRQNEFF